MVELLTSANVLRLDLVSVLGAPRCRCSCLSFIRAELMASFNILCRNIRTAFAISGLSPPMKVPTRAR